MLRKREDRAKKQSNIITQVCECGNNRTIRRSRKNSKGCWQCRDWVSHKRIVIKKQSTAK